MARPRNLLKTQRITLSTSEQIGEYLEELANMGLWGKNATDAAERLIADQIRRLIQEGILELRKKEKSSAGGGPKGHRPP